MISGTLLCCPEFFTSLRHHKQRRLSLLNYKSICVNCLESSSSSARLSILDGKLGTVFHGHICWLSVKICTLVYRLTCSAKSIIHHATVTKYFLCGLRGSIVLSVDLLMLSLPSFNSHGVHFFSKQPVLATSENLEAAWRWGYYGLADETVINMCMPCNLVDCIDFVLFVEHAVSQ